MSEVPGSERVVELLDIVSPEDRKRLEALEAEAAAKAPTFQVHEQIEIKGVLFDVAEVKTRGRIMLKVARPRRWRCLHCNHRELAVRRPSGCPKCQKVSHESMLKKPEGN